MFAKFTAHINLPAKSKLENRFFSKADNHWQRVIILERATNQKNTKRVWCVYMS